MFACASRNLLSRQDAEILLLFQWGVISMTAADDCELRLGTSITTWAYGVCRTMLLYVPVLLMLASAIEADVKALYNTQRLLCIMLPLLLRLRCTSEEYSL